MESTVIAVVHEFDGNLSIELFRTLEAARDNVRRIIEEHFGYATSKAASKRLHECLEDLETLAPDDAGIVLEEGEATVELRALALPN